MLEYQNKKHLQKTTLQIDLKRFLLLRKLKILCQQHVLLGILTVKKLSEPCIKKNCKRQIKQNL